MTSTERMQRHRQRKARKQRQDEKQRLRAQDARQYSPIIKPMDNWNFTRSSTAASMARTATATSPARFMRTASVLDQAGDIVVAPIAGAGQIMRVYEDRATWAGPNRGSWISACSTSPHAVLTATSSSENDATVGIPVCRPRLHRMDVPYFGMVAGQGLSKTTT